MKLLVIRHAEAEDLISSKDQDRKLSEEGKEQFERLCGSLQSFNWKFDLLLTSSLARARETADIFLEFFKVKERKLSDNLKPSADPGELLLELSLYKLEKVVIVSHQPFLGEFMELVLKGERVFVERGSITYLDLPRFEPGSGSLECFFAPLSLRK